MPLYSTPLGSPTTSSNWSYVHVPRAPPAHAPLATARAYGPCSGLGGYSRVGNTGVYYPAIPRLREPPQTAKRAPEALQGAGVGGLGWRNTLRARHPPFGPGRVPGPSLVPPRANAASQPIRARFHLIYCKVSQNSIVSPEYV